MNYTLNISFEEKENVVKHLAQSILIKLVFDTNAKISKTVLENLTDKTEFMTNIKTLLYKF